MDSLHPEVALYAGTLLRLERHLEDHGDAERAARVRRCRIAAENSDGWSVECFLSLFGYMGDFGSAGLPAAPGDRETVNRLLGDYIDDALAQAKALQQEPRRER